MSRGQTEDRPEEEEEDCPIAQALKFCEFASKPVQSGLSSSIGLEVVYI